MVLFFRRLVASGVQVSFFGAMNMLGLAKRVNARILQASTSEVRRTKHTSVRCHRRGKRHVRRSETSERPVQRRARSTAWGLVGRPLVRLSSRFASCWRLPEKRLAEERCARCIVVDAVPPSTTDAKECCIASLCCRYTGYAFRNRQRISRVSRGTCKGQTVWYRVGSVPNFLVSRRVMLFPFLKVYGDAQESPQTESYWGNVNCHGETTPFRGILGAK